MGVCLLRPVVPFVPRVVDLPKQFNFQGSADRKWLLVVPDNSSDWKVIVDWGLVQEAVRLPDFEAYGYTVQGRV